MYKFINVVHIKNKIFLIGMKVVGFILELSEPPKDNHPLVFVWMIDLIIIHEGFFFPP